MVVALGPGRFYGSSLPRPHIYTDVKLNTERVDPPACILEPLLSWASEAHWSMGGHSFTRLRLQGRIEGNIKRLKTEKRKQIKLHAINLLSSSTPKSVSPPPAPRATKRRRRLVIDDDDDDDDEEEDFDDDDDSDDESDLDKESPKVAAAVASSSIGSRLRRKRVRKLVDEFDKVASDSATEEDQIQTREITPDPSSSVEMKTIKRMKTRASRKPGKSSSSTLAKDQIGTTVASRTRSISRSEMEETPVVATVKSNGGRMKRSSSMDRETRTSPRNNGDSLSLSPKTRTSPRLSRLS